MSEPSSGPPRLEGTVSVHDPAEAEALMAAGATLQRHAHQMRLALPLPACDEPEFIAFHADATPPVPWHAVLPAFEAAYPPEHPDHLPSGPAEPALSGGPSGPAEPALSGGPGGASLIDSYLIPYTVGAQLGPLLSHASAIAVREGYAYGGILIVDRPGEGAWVCDIWRDPRREYSGTGTALLRWAAARLVGFDSLGLVVTVGNDSALRAYERVGFTIESTAWTLRPPHSAAR